MDNLVLNKILNFGYKFSKKIKIINLNGKILWKQTNQLYYKQIRKDNFTY